MRNNLLIILMISYFSLVVFTKEIVVSRIHRGSAILFLDINNSNKFMIEFFLRSNGNKLPFQKTPINQRNIQISRQGKLIGYENDHSPSGKEAADVKISERCKFIQDPGLWLCNLNVKVKDGLSNIQKIAKNPDHFFKLQMRFVYNEKNYTTLVDGLKFYLNSVRVPSY